MTTSTSTTSSLSSSFSSFSFFDELPLRDCTNSEAPTTFEFQGQTLMKLLPSKLKEMYEENGCSLDKIAQDSEKLSFFLSVLIHNNYEIAPVIKYFTQPHYDTKVYLAFKDTQNGCFCLELLKEKFNIHAIELDDPFMKGNDLQAILSRLPNLTALHLKKASAIAESEYSSIRYPTRLQSIIFESCKIGDIGLEQCFSCCSESLAVLTIINCGKITFEKIDSTSLLLHILYIKNCSITDRGLIQISQIQGLSELSLINCLFIPANLTCSLAQTLQHLTLVGLKITDRSFANMTSRCKKLESVYLAYCPFVTTVQLPETMRYLTLDNINVQAGAVVGILDSCQALLLLSLAGCSKLSKQDFASFTYPRSIKEVNVSETSIDARGVNKLLIDAPGVEFISLKDCKNLPAILQKTEMNSNQVSDLLETLSDHIPRALSDSLEQPLFEMELQ